MTITKRSSSIAVFATVFFALSALASAQATRTWVSGVGDDVNPCSRTAPCKTFAGAISKTAPGGEINCIDSGGFGAVTITKGMTIDGEGALGSILAAGTNGVVINAGATDKIVLRNLEINGAGTGINGIRFLAGGELCVENVRIHGFTTNGIDVNRSTGGNLAVRNTIISKCNGTGIKLITTAGTIFSTLDNVKINGCPTGIDANNGSRVGMRGCDLTLCTNGLMVQHSTLSARADVDTCFFLYHNNAIQSGPGANSVVRLTNNTISNNTMALLGSGGTFFTAGNNKLMGNSSDGATPTLINQK